MSSDFEQQAPFLCLKIEMLPDGADEYLSFYVPERRADGSWRCSIISDGNRLQIDTEIVGENALQCIVLIPVFIRKVVLSRDDVVQSIEGIDGYIAAPEYIPFTYGKTIYDELSDVVADRLSALTGREKDEGL